MTDSLNVAVVLMGAGFVFWSGWYARGVSEHLKTGTEDMLRACAIDAEAERDA